jgi:hypothetical protein
MRNPLRRYKPETRQQVMSMIEAIDLLNRVVRAIEQENHAEVFRLIGITDEIANQAQDARELYEIAAVRIANITQLAKLEIKP